MNGSVKAAGQQSIPAGQGKATKLRKGDTIKVSTCQPRVLTHG